MKILITGNMGYIGPVVTRRLKAAFPNAELIGLDLGFFAHCLTNEKFLPECMMSRQIFGDVRNVDEATLAGVDAIVHLAAISNDPMGNTYEKVTLAINHQASVQLAKTAKKAGVKNFVFASSCSVYGAADDGARTEDSPLNPLTAYAKSKINTETDIKGLADDKFNVTCLRFATACGMTNRLRLDLVLNDFVAGAVTAKKISIMSDGTPWRPLIHVEDMARAIEWAVTRKASNGGAALVVNAGSNDWNYQVREIADAVAQVMPGVSVSVNKDAPPDKRSYRVDFARFKSLAPNHQPQVTLAKAAEALRAGLEGMGFHDANFRESRFIRLKVLTAHRDEGRLDAELRWNFKV